MRLAEKTSHRDTLQVLCNLPGLKEPNSERRKDLFVACNVKNPSFSLEIKHAFIYLHVEVTRVIRQC